MVSDHRSSEAGTNLTLEKIKVPSGPGGPFDLVAKSNFPIKKYGPAVQKAFKKLAFETSLGCCDYNNIICAREKVSFDLALSPKVSFKCEIKFKEKSFLYRQL